MSAPLLLIDAGNTRVKWASVVSGGRIRPVGDLATEQVTAVKIQSLAKKFRQHRVVLASVVPTLVPIFRKAFGRRIEIVHGHLPTLGLRFKYPKPGELGADRLAVAVALQDEGIWPAIVISCGTATAFTVLDARGQLCGGVIAPGLQTQLAALIGATAQLPALTLRAPSRSLGRSTEEAIRAGVMLNFQGGVKEILRRLVSELPGGSAPQVVLTGGHAHHLAMTLDGPATLRPLLVFEGLRIIGIRAFKETETS